MCNELMTQQKEFTRKTLPKKFANQIAQRKNYIRSRK